MPDLPDAKVEPHQGSERIEDVEAFALANGLRIDQAQALIDRVGNDRQALEDAALIKEAEKDDPSDASE